MKNKFISTATLLFAVALLMTVFSCSAFAADAAEVLTYQVAKDGYVTVADCDTGAKGTVTVPNKVTINKKTYEVKYIGQKAFDGCKKITVIKLSEGITAIKSRAFRDCTSLKELYVPSTLEICEYDAFEGCNTVTVHCYTSNYPFFSICSGSSDLVIDVLDPENDQPEEEKPATETEAFFTRLANAIKNLVETLMERFAADDEFDFSIEDLPFDLPFDIPTDDSSSDFPFDILG